MSQKRVGSSIKGRRNRAPSEVSLESITSNAPRVDPAFGEDAEEFVRRRLRVGRLQELSADEEIDLLLAEVVTANKMTNEQHLEALAFAYALYVRAQTRADLRSIVFKLATRIGRTLRKDTNPLQIFVEAVITYGENTPERRREARRLYNRDAQAIEHLIENNVEPSKVVAFAGNAKGALQRWARSDGSRGAKPGRKREEATAAKDYVAWVRCTPGGQVEIVQRAEVGALPEDMRASLVKLAAGLTKWVEDRRLGRVPEPPAEAVASLNAFARQISKAMKVARPKT